MPGRQSYTDSPAEGGGGGEEGCSTLPGLWPEACGLALSGCSHLRPSSGTWKRCLSARRRWWGEGQSSAQTLPWNLGSVSPLAPSFIYSVSVDWAPTGFQDPAWYWSWGGPS